MSGKRAVRRRSGQRQQGKELCGISSGKDGTSWKGKLKIAVDTLIPQVASFEELLQRLQAAGYAERRENISCRAPGQERFTRLKTLGADYTEEAIKERIAGKRTKAAKLPKSSAAYRCLSTLKTVSRHKRAGAMNSGRKSII